MTKPFTIPKINREEFGPDHNVLRKTGLDYIEKLSGKLWTDYNTHDPGITFLELLCYAITDLNYRTGLPIEDLLATDTDNIKSMHKQFLSALHILPSAPVTANDYRQLLVRIEGIKNVWLSKHQTSIIANYKKHPTQLRYSSPDEAPIANEELSFTLKGLNDVLVEYEETELTDPLEISARKQEIKERVQCIYHRYRNLCEDIVEVKEVPEQEIVVCTDIELHPKTDPEQVYAEIACAIAQYLSPEINFYDLPEMLEKGYSSDQIFEGPVFDYSIVDANGQVNEINKCITKKGFIDNKELSNSELKNHIRLSDIIRVINAIEGVKLIRSISFGFCSCQEKDPGKVSQSFNKDIWELCIKPGFKPSLCLENSVINFYKDIIPIELKMAEARTKTTELKRQQAALQISPAIEDLTMPVGNLRSPGYYFTMQNQLPEVYGVGANRLPDSASAERKAQAKQLKAYLLFFDQVLANYFSQLSHVKTLLSVDDTSRKTYFNNAVAFTRSFSEEEIYTGADTWEANVDAIYKHQELDPFISRKNKFLDHLLARFNEQFSEYVFLLQRVYGTDFDYAIIRNKTEFYKDYEQVSTYRGVAFDYFNAQKTGTEALNVSGLEKRLSRLLGFNNYLRFPLATLPYSVAKLEVANPNTRYNWSIKKEGGNILIGTGTAYRNVDSYEELGLASIIGSDEMSYRFTLSADGKKAGYVITDSSGNLAAQSFASEVLPNALNTAILLPAAMHAITQVVNATATNFVFHLSADNKNVTFDLRGNSGSIIAHSPVAYPLLPNELALGTYSEAQKVIAKILDANNENFLLIFSEDQSMATFILPDPSGEVLLTATAYFPVVKSGLPANTFNTVIQNIKALVAYFIGDFKLEGLHIVENILLRPQPPGVPDAFMPVCINTDGSYCYPLDPYSFRINIVLPGYTLRLRNKYFRMYAEKIIRLETPAHILPRICFVGEEGMQAFEADYFTWIDLKQKAATDSNNADAQLALANASSKFINTLEDLFTVYDQGQLADCDDDTIETNPVILGQTFLGTNESDSFSRPL